MGLREAVPVLTCAVPEDLVHDWFPMEVAGVQGSEVPVSGVLAAHHP